MPRNVDDFANSDLDPSLFESNSKSLFSPLDPEEDLGFPTRLREGSRRAFLVELDQESQGHYRAILERFNLSVQSFDAMSQAATAINESWPSVALVSRRGINEWLPLLLQSANGWRLLPDQIVLLGVDDYIEKEIQKEASVLGSPREIDSDFEELSEAPLVFKTVLHPAEAHEMEAVLETLLGSRAAREEHLRRQRERSLYGQCMQLASVDSRGPLMRLGLEMVLDTTSALGGAVLKHQRQGLSVECFSGLENVKMEKTLEHLKAHLALESPGIEWIALPSNYTKGRKNSLGPQAVVLPLAPTEGGLLQVLVFTGKDSRWRDHLLQDVKLLLTHARMAFQRLEEKERGAPVDLRDPWTGFLREEALLDSVRGRLKVTGQDRRGKKRQDQSLAFIVLDVDGFTQINSRKGHLGGGFILRHLAKRLLDVLGGRGMLARIGPDEFGVVVEGAYADSVEELAREIWEEIRRRPINLGQRGQEERVTVTVGFCVSSDSRQDPSALLHKARDAVEQARREGGDRVEGFRS